MADHLSDEEQLEALKKWWQKNGTSLLLVLVLSAGGWFGWNYWQKQKEATIESASHIYNAMIDAEVAWEADASEENAARVATQGENLKAIDEKSLYARVAAMTLAKLYLADKEYENAVAELEWALERTDQPELAALIRLRLANVEFASDNGQRALELLGMPHPVAYSALYDELRGDVLVSMGEDGEALGAYESALTALNTESASSERARAMIELKINDLKPAAPEQAATGEEEA